MKDNSKFDLLQFTPYLLNLAAEESSLGFQRYYKDRYGMLRTEWRVLFHLGRYGDMTATDICRRARLHKTKVSRAVAALQEKRFLERTQLEIDRRREQLTLTAVGRKAYLDLSAEAERFDQTLLADLPEAEVAMLRNCLAKLARLDG